MKLSKSQRLHIRYMFGGKCAYCGCDLGDKWHVDHVEAIRRDWEYMKDEHGNYVTTKDGITRTRATGKLYAPENDTLENLFPACIKCNILKSAENVEGFRSTLTYMAHSVPRIEGYSHVRHLIRFGKLTIDPTPVVFWFEKYAELTETR